MLGVHWILSDMSALNASGFSNWSAYRTPGDALQFSNSVINYLHAKLVFKSGNYILYRIPQKTLVQTISIDKTTKFLNQKDSLLSVALGKNKSSEKIDCPFITNLKNSSGSTNQFSLTGNLSRLSKKKECTAVLRLPFSANWHASITSNGKVYKLVGNKVYGFANGFQLPMGLSGQFKLEFDYEESTYFGLTQLVSFVSLLAILLTLIVTYKKRINTPKNIDQ
jgi:hypothetical protein